MSTQQLTENLTIHHKVKDYPAWRKGYDEHEKSRASAGVTNGRVFRSAEDPNDILVVMDVADAAKARAWLRRKRSESRDGEGRSRWAARRPLLGLRLKGA